MRSRPRLRRGVCCVARVAARVPDVSPVRQPQQHVAVARLRGTPAREVGAAEFVYVVDQPAAVEVGARTWRWLRRTLRDCRQPSAPASVTAPSTCQTKSADGRCRGSATGCRSFPVPSSVIPGSAPRCRASRSGVLRLMFKAQRQVQLRRDARSSCEKMPRVLNLHGRKGVVLEGAVYIGDRLYRGGGGHRSFCRASARLVVADPDQADHAQGHLRTSCHCSSTRRRLPLHP